MRRSRPTILGNGGLLFLPVTGKTEICSWAASVRLKEVEKKPSRQGGLKRSGRLFAGRSRRGSGGHRRCVLYADQLDIENQGGAGRNRLVALVAVGQRGRDVE